MAPKIGAAVASRISIRTRSPNFRNGVCGAPCSMVSMARRSAMQDEPDGAVLVCNGAGADDGARQPAGGSWPHARSGAGNRTSCRHARWGGRTSAPFSSVTSGRSIEPPFHASPNSSGVTATGEKARPGFALEEAEALRELRRDQVAQRHVVGEHHQPDVRAAPRRRYAHRHVVGDHRHLGFEIDAPGLVGERDRDRGRRENSPSRPGTSAGSVQKVAGMPSAARPPHQLDVDHIGPAVRPLIGAGQGCGAFCGSKAKGLARAVLFQGCGAGAQVCGAHAAQSSSAACSVGRDRDRRRRGVEIARDDHQAPVAARFQRCQLHPRPSSCRHSRSIRPLPRGAPSSGSRASIITAYFVGGAGFGRQHRSSAPWGAARG